VRVRSSRGMGWTGDAMALKVVTHAQQETGRGQ
jgi:hypothetical protein